MSSINHAFLVGKLGLAFRLMSIEQLDFVREWIVTMTRKFKLFLQIKVKSSTHQRIILKVGLTVSMRKCPSQPLISLQSSATSTYSQILGTLELFH